MAQSGLARRQAQSRAAPLSSPDQRLQIFLGADSDLGALPLAAVPPSAALLALPGPRSHGLRHIFDRLHGPGADRAELVAAARRRRDLHGPGDHPAAAGAHLSAAERRL